MLLYSQPKGYALESLIFRSLFLVDFSYGNYLRKTFILQPSKIVFGGAMMLVEIINLFGLSKGVLNLGTKAFIH
jgi:hypothetical protein